MDHRAAELFVTVVERGSFTAAARALGLPKSSISRAVTRLERDLGVRLLQRTTRQLALTDVGRDFHERARVALRALDEAACAAREQGDEPGGVVRVTAPPTSFALDFGNAIAEFCAKYPRIHVELVVTSRLVDLVADGVDMAIRAGVLEDSSLVARKVGNSESMLFASPGYLDRRGRPREFSELSRHDFLVYRPRMGKTLRLLGPNGEEAVEVSGPASADDLPLLRELCIAGAGIGLFPLEVAVRPARDGLLEPVLPEYRLRGAGVYVVLPSSAFVPARVAALRDFLVERLGAEFAALERACLSHGGPPGGGAQPTTARARVTTSSPRTSTKSRVRSRPGDTHVTARIGSPARASRS